MTVIRSRRERDEAEPRRAPPPRPSRGQADPDARARVHVMEPKGFNDAQEVGDRLKAGQPVILNLQGVDRDLQRRLIDFSSGLAYALSGTMSKAADQVFLLTPSNVEVSEEEKERLQARGLYRAVAHVTRSLCACSPSTWSCCSPARSLSWFPVRPGTPVAHRLRRPARSHRAGSRAVAAHHPAGRACSTSRSSC